MGEALGLEGGGGLGFGFGFGLDLFGAFFIGVGPAAEADELGVVTEVNLIGRQDFAAEIAVGDGGGEDFAPVVAFFLGEFVAPEEFELRDGGGGVAEFAVGGGWRQDAGCWLLGCWTAFKDEG